MDGGRTAASLAAHDAGGLAGEGGVENLAVDSVGDVPCERRLAGAGIAEEAEDLPIAALDPARDGFKRGILLGRPLHIVRCRGFSPPALRLHPPLAHGALFDHPEDQVFDEEADHDDAEQAGKD